MAAVELQRQVEGAALLTLRRSVDEKMFSDMTVILWGIEVVKSRPEKMRDSQRGSFFQRQDRLPASDQLSPRVANFLVSSQFSIPKRYSFRGFCDSYNKVNSGLIRVCGLSSVS